MGWWTADEDGHSFGIAVGEEIVWGDGPADIMDGALHAIEREFIRTWERKPSERELISGLLFSWRSAEAD